MVNFRFYVRIMLTTRIHLLKRITNVKLLERVLPKYQNHTQLLLEVYNSPIELETPHKMDKLLIIMKRLEMQVLIWHHLGLITGQVSKIH